MILGLTSFGSTEQRHCNLLCFIIRLILESFRTFLKQITISLTQQMHIGKNSISAMHTTCHIRLSMSTIDSNYALNFDMLHYHFTFDWMVLTQDLKDI